MENKIYDAEIKVEVNKWNKVIKVNEDGDTITLNVGDVTLNSRLCKLLKDIQTSSEELSKSEHSDDPDSVLETLELMVEKQKYIAIKIDEFFGKDTCYKVFKTNTPYIDDVMDFMFQMLPLIEKFTGQKMQNLENIQKKYIDKQKTRRKI